MGAECGTVQQGGSYLHVHRVHDTWGWGGYCVSSARSHFEDLPGDPTHYGCGLLAEAAAGSLMSEQTPERRTLVLAGPLVHTPPPLPRGLAQMQMPAQQSHQNGCSQQENL